MTDVTAGVPVAASAPEVRTRFMGRVYGHLVGGIAAFIAAQYVLFTTGLAETIHAVVVATNWLLILGGFMVVSWLATHLARQARTSAGAYGAYGVLVLANALLFAAPLYAANEFVPGAISTAAWLSLLAFVGLSVVALTTSKDFSFLRGLLLWGGIVALVAIVGAVLFDVALGTWFSVAMIAFAGAAILYDTQKVYRSFPAQAVVPAAMHLFSSVALLFWYVLRLVMQRR